MSCRSAPTMTRTRGPPASPRSATSQPFLRRTASRPAARPVKFAIVAPVTNPTALPSGRPSRSSSHALAMSSTALWAGVTRRMAQFWSQALTSQSAARAAGCVPPTTKPKKRPEGMAVRPASQARASRSTTSAGSDPPSGRARPNAFDTSSIEARGGTGRSSSDTSQASACRCARSSAAECRSTDPVSTGPRPATRDERPRCLCSVPRTAARGASQPSIIRTVDGVLGFSGRSGPRRRRGRNRVAGQALSETW